MHQNKKTVFLALIATVLGLNAFIGGLLAYALSAAKERKEQEVRTTVENMALLLDQSVTASVREIELLLRELQVHLEHELREGRPLVGGAMSDLIAEHGGWLSQPAEIRVTDASGAVVLGHGVTPETKVNASNRDFFIEHREKDDGRTRASKLIYGRVAETWVVVFSRRYNAPDGRFAGIVVAAVSAAYFQELLSGLRLGPHGIALIRDQDMVMIARWPVLDSPAGAIGSRGGSQELSDIVASGVPAQSFYSTRTADGVTRINAYRRLERMPAFVVLGWGEKDYLTQWHEDVRKAMLLWMLFLAVTVLAGGLLWRLVNANARANQRSRILLQNASDGIHIMDGDGNVVEASDAFCRMLGYAHGDIIGMNVSQWDAYYPEQALREGLSRLLASSEVHTFESAYRRKDGSVLPVEISAFPLEVDGKTVLFNSARDITARKSSEAEVRRLAYFDPLTGLPNRRLLMERLEFALEACARDGSKGALLFIDLDNFKAVNDTVGHAEGDRLLEQVAAILIHCVRRDDTVARLGGDEFVVMLQDLGGDGTEASHHAEAIGSKILQALHKRFELGSSEHRVSASVGVTLFGDHPGERVEEPLKRADMAMYQAKLAGRNALRFFDPKMQAEVSARAAVEAGLWEAMEKQQFLLQYQPQIAADGTVIGVEALVRWRHPERGVIPPGEFIPLAEESGLILPLGRWVLETACAQLAAWAWDPRRAQLKIAVNVSARQFRQEDFVAEVLNALEHSGANPARLELELTESSLVTDIDRVGAKMDALKARGVGFSLDDFGTGYSSLAYLKRLPLEQLKIDQGFVRDILIDPNDAAIARMIIVLADNLGLGVVAEGVESDEQRAFLAEQGCRIYQGYLFSRPLALAELEAFLDARRAIAV
ncbi:MAG TPA: EAL domain-containing protein [Thauera sp.]|uniref:bifunctional diguanylate cyclase/phosphodiesterase n=1 Tax=Thauera sp. TaxID=1905334 RepID=UPI002CFB116D|nr:EAL domain-containing protein [Thauera sp.]HRP24480.1 EAL domain-containing protein [Thauera sp.]HRP67287.1 EAL domain-containing protein [Thauera sp.]